MINITLRILRLRLVTLKNFREKSLLQTHEVRRMSFTQLSRFCKREAVIKSILRYDHRSKNGNFEFVPAKPLKKIIVLE